MKREFLSGASSLVVSSLVLMSFLTGPAVASASATTGMPAQSECDSGSTTFTWSGLGLSRPVIASLSVDGETITDPTHPVDGSIGASVCPNVDAARKTGLTVYYRHGSQNDYDLTGAVTPVGHHPITGSSVITITLTNMGSLAKYYSFSLVHGVVSTWTPANLGTDSASLTVALSPVRTPAGTGEDSASGFDFRFCTATPPHCNATQSQADALSASLDMDFDQTGHFAAFTGAYFGLTGAMGGFVEPTRTSTGANALVATLGAPHFLADGVTRNTGSMQAFLPNAVLDTLFGLPAGGVDTAALAVTRSDDATLTSVPFTVTPSATGVLVEVSDITFSSPVYTITKALKVLDSVSQAAIDGVKVSMVRTTKVGKKVKTTKLKGDLSLLTGVQGAGTYSAITVTAPGYTTKTLASVKLTKDGTILKKDLKLVKKVTKKSTKK